MTKTENYNLPQWEGGDPIRREDFNAAFAKLDSMGYVIGKYVGNDVTMEKGGQFIELGFKPRFLFITRGWSGASSVTHFLAIGEESASTVDSHCILEDNGFTVGHVSAGGPIKLNVNEYVYCYLAFR